jgi:hypothetical protein
MQGWGTFAFSVNVKVLALLPKACLFFINDLRVVVLQCDSHVWSRFLYVIAETIPLTLASFGSKFWVRSCADVNIFSTI